STCQAAECKASPLIGRACDQNVDRRRNGDWLAYCWASCWQAFPAAGSLAWMAEVRVECHAGYRGDETPRRFHLEGKTIEIAAIIGRWKEPGVLLFRVQSIEGRVYL